MAPTRMKLRVRRRAGAAGGSQPAEDQEKSRASRSSRRKNANNAASTSAAPAAADATPPPSTSTTATTTVASTSTRAMVAAEDASPDSKCPICLDRFNNLAYLDRCLHRFCFPCIQEWSHNKAECPLCKQPFASILHSVRAEDDFKEYTLRPPHNNSSVAATVAMVAAMVSAARNDPRMLRLMLRRNRAADGGGSESLIRRTRRERGGRGGRGAGVWEMYFDSPTLPLASLSPNLAAADDVDEGEELGQQANARGRPDPGRGVIFDGLTGPRTTRTHNDRTYRRLMTRLVARRRQQQEGGALRRLRERETVAFRRGLYRCGIRVHGVAGVSDSRAQQGDVSAESFRHNPAHLNKLRPWLRRELTVLYGAHNSLVDIVQRIITAQLSRHGLEDTPTIEEELRPFLLARTDHFLHELVSFARSPLTLESYDLQAAYEPPAAAMELEGMSSPSDGSSVIAISEGEEEEGPVGGRSEEGGAASAHDDDVIQAGSCLSLSAWDDETPGPSYSTAEPSCSLTPLTSSSAHQEAERTEEECLIVGYKKPIAERTPELVQLSSDTEDEGVKAKKEEESVEKAPPLPSATSPPLSIPPSTSSAFREEPDESLKEKSDEAAATAATTACRSRSWSASSGRSCESVCSISPSERRHDNDNRKRRKKRRRAQEKSGTLYNPNRSIYPAMMCRHPHTPSPFHSSAESGSPLPPSPLDSSWDFNCSSLTSSSPSSRASSPLCLSPQASSPQTPPTPSLSPGDAQSREKPGGKRKYKSRHLDSNDKDPTWRPGGGGDQRERRQDGESRKRKTRDGRRRRRRKEGGGYRGDSRKCRDDRSPSVEIVYERSCDAALPPSRKRRRKGHRNPQHSSSPVIITLDSDSSRDAVNSSSSPLSSQQTVDFSDLPPLPLAHSAGVGGALDEDVGELPVDILDRGSDGSEAEATRPIDVGSVSNSDRDIDVENDDDDEPPLSARGPIAAAEQRAPVARDKRHRRKSNPRKSASPSDSRLLAAILEDLKGIVAPKHDLPLNFDSPNSRKRRSRNPDAADSELNGAKDQSRDSELPTCSSSAPSLSPPQQQTRSMDVPPLLKRASPVRAHNRNTPPPLKHKDAGSPRLSPVTTLLSDSNSTPPLVDSRLPGDDDVDAIPPISTLKKHLANSLALRGASDDSSASAGPLLLPLTFYSPSDWPPPSLRFPPVNFLPVNSVSPVDFRSTEPAWSGPARCDGKNAIGLNSSRVPPDDFHGAGDAAAGGGVFSGVASNDVSSTLLASTVESDDLSPRSRSTVNFHTLEPASSRPFYTGHGKNTASLNSSRVPPNDFHVSGGKSAGDATLLALTVDARTRSSSSPDDSSISRDNPSQRSRSPVEFHTMEPASSRPFHTGHWKNTVSLNSSRVPPSDFHVAGSKVAGDATLLALTVDARTRDNPCPRSPKRTVHSSSAASEGLTDARTSSTVSRQGLAESTSATAHASSNSRVTATRRLNHTALPSLAFDAVNAEDNSQSDRIVGSQPKLHNHFDANSVSKQNHGDAERDGRIANSDA